jgi:AraC-like DNA-binding protein
MSHLRAAVLHAGETARVTDVACSAPRSGCGEPEHAGAAVAIVPRRGIFQVHRPGGEPVAADATCAVVLGAGDEYRVSHPADGGDRCTTIGVPNAQAEEILGRRRGAVRLAPRAQLAVAALVRSLARRALDGLEAEEAALLALGAVAGDERGGAVQAPRAGGAGGTRPGRAARATRRRRVAEVRALLAADPARPWRLADIGRAVHCSPYHLARQFRAETGTSVGGHLARLRAGLALDRLADGDDDLARVGLDAGFAHHSHFTARFRAVFGITPSQARDGDVRTIATAAAAARA